MSICVVIQDCIRREFFHRILAARACRAPGSRAPSPSSRYARIWSRPFGLRSLADDPRWSRGSSGRATGGRTRFRGFAAPAGAPLRAPSAPPVARRRARPREGRGLPQPPFFRTAPAVVVLLHVGANAPARSWDRWRSAAPHPPSCAARDLRPRACSDRVAPRRGRPRSRIEEKI